MIIKTFTKTLLLMFALSVNAITLEVPSYPEDGVIPNDFACGGSSNISPQLIWDDVPAGTMSFAVVFNDNTLNFLHWKLYNIDAAIHHLPEDNPNNSGVNGFTDFGIQGYGGPCPPGTGNYVMTVYALNTIFTNEPSVGQIQSAAIESATWSAFRSFNSDEPRYEYAARYRLTFMAEWSATSHPIDYPASAHFSPLVGSTHAATGSIWQVAGISSDGMEEMAESGGTGTLNTEIESSIDASGSESRLNGTGADGEDMVTLEFDVSNSHPLFSMVTMIAPSPDWFVGVADLDLRENGVWQSNVTVDLLPFDAGTQAGVTFTNPGGNTFPRDAIMQITTDPFPNNVPLGQFVFELLSTEGEPLDVIFMNGFD